MNDFQTILLGRLPPTGNPGFIRFVSEIWNQLFSVKCFLLQMSEEIQDIDMSVDDCTVQMAADGGEPNLTKTEHEMEKIESVDRDRDPGTPVYENPEKSFSTIEKSPPDGTTDKLNEEDGAEIKMINDDNQELETSVKQDPLQNVSVQIFCQII